MDLSLLDRVADLDQRIAANRTKAAELRALSEAAHANPAECKDWARVAGWRERADALEAEAARLAAERQSLEQRRSAELGELLLAESEAIRQRLGAVIEALAGELAPHIAETRRQAQAAAIELTAAKNALSRRSGELRRDDRHDLGAAQTNLRQLIGNLWPFVMNRSSAIADELMKGNRDAE